MTAYGLRALGQHTTDIQAYSSATIFSPVEHIVTTVSALLTAHPLPAALFQSVPTITGGYARTLGLPKLFLQVLTLVSLHIGPSLLEGVRPAIECESWYRKQIFHKLNLCLRGKKLRKSALEHCPIAFH